MSNYSEITDPNLPTIICMADCKHYFIQNFKLQTRQKIKQNLTWALSYNGTDKTTFNSLHEAKHYLRDNNVTAVNIAFQSAYDEMCGNDVKADYAITMRL